MIGVVTYSRQPDLTDDDRPLIAALGLLGVDARPVRWDDESVRWADFGALVMRSTWDYHLRVAEFEQWLSAIELAAVPMWNPVPLVRWNMHKKYLRALQQASVRIPRTRWLARDASVPLADILREERWTVAIVKPAISASATDTWRVHADSRTDAERFDALSRRADVLVQELVPEIAAAGEWSLIFIGGAFSHSTLKMPGHGDFRVQTELGGSAVAARAPAPVIAAGEAIAEHIPRPWLFARIDGVVTPRGFTLMEIECIEPHLFFGHGPGSHQRFALALREITDL